MILIKPARSHYIETILAWVVIIYAVRTMLPIGTSSAVYANLDVKIVFGLLVGLPGIWLLLAKKPPNRAKALLAVVFTDIYLATLALIIDWTRFASGAAPIGLAAIGVILYVGARAEGGHR